MLNSILTILKASGTSSLNQLQSAAYFSTYSDFTSLVVLYNMLVASRCNYT